MVPRIDAIYALHDNGGTAVARALEEKGYAPGHVKVVCHIGSKGSLDNLREDWNPGIVIKGNAAQFVGW